ncbi:MAG TPA: glycerol-3-phosphate 1-O-acyltransferase PlsY [Humisphaera sp.]
MSPQQKLLALLPVAYLVGSIPFGLLVGLARGVDVRKGGSGNIGATNVGRLLGGKFFALVFVLDLLKGLVPVLAAGALANFGGAVDGHPPTPTTFLLWLGVGFAAIAGHMFSVFLKFKGGKGVATSAGVILGLFPFFTYPGLVAVGVWAAVFFARRIVSLASIVGAAVFPLAYVAFALAARWDLGVQWPLLAFAFLIGAMIVFRHRSNIARLRAGTEARIGGGRRKHAGGNGDGHHAPGNGDGGADEGAAPGRPAR